MVDRRDSRRTRHARRGRRGADRRQPERDRRLPGRRGPGISGARRRPIHRHGRRSPPSAVKTTDALPVLDPRLGTVQEGAAIKRGEGSHNARPAVIIGIQKQPAVNTLELTERIDATLAEIQRALPPGMQIQRICFAGRLHRTGARQSVHGAARRRGAGHPGRRPVPDERAGGRHHAGRVAVLADCRGRRDGPFRLHAQHHEPRRSGDCDRRARGRRDHRRRERRAAAAAERGAARRPSACRSLDVVYHASTEIRHSVVFATVIVALVFVPLFMLGSVEGRLLRPLGFALRRRADARRWSSHSRSRRCCVRCCCRQSR